MRVAVIGSTGRTGSLVVTQALARHHDVTAVARSPQTDARRPGLVSVAGDVLDQGSITRALTGADAVVSAVGIGTSRNPTVVYSRGTTHILQAMQTLGIRRLTVVSAAPVGPRNQLPVGQRLILPILDRVFGATYDDMRRMETELEASDLDWVALRPPRLLNRPATGEYRIDAEQPVPKGNHITHADLAVALLECLDHDVLYQRAVWIAN